MSIRIDPERVDRRIRMLTNHIKNPTLRPVRRRKMQEELKVLLKIKALYEKQVAEIKAKASQQKLEEAVPELKEVAEEADKVHETAMIGALPSGEPDESASS